MTDNVTSIEPQDSAANKEPERKVRTFRVLRRTDGSDWEEIPDKYDTVYNPDAQEVGHYFGEGDYLLIECDDKYDFQYVYPMRVVAEKRYRLADEDA